MSGFCFCVCMYKLERMLNFNILCQQFPHKATSAVTSYLKVFIIHHPQSHKHSRNLLVQPAKGLAKQWSHDGFVA